MKFVRKYIWSYDTIISIIISFVCMCFLPDYIGGELVKDLLGMGIGVLSIIFSIFFAALAFIISASDDEFVSFLEKKGLFTKLINTFRWTVGSLFFALFYSILLYVVTAFRLSLNSTFQISEILMVIFCFMFFYSLLATIESTNDAIRYSKTRITFVELMKQNGNEQQE